MATPQRHQLNHLLSDVPLEATPPRSAPNIQLTASPNGHSTLSPFALSDAGIYMGDDTRDFIIRQQSVWLQNTAMHGRAPTGAIPDDLSSDTNFPYDEDSEDDFKFNPCGESRFHRRHRNRINRQRAEKLAAQAQNIDSSFHEESLTISQRMFVEDRRISRLKVMDKLKLNLRLALVLRLLELTTYLWIGFRYSVETWMVYGFQTLLNGCASCCLLWRFAGKYSLPEDAVSCEMCDRLKTRERRCIMWQSIFKFLSAAITLILASLGVKAASREEDSDNYFYPAVTALALAIIGSLSRGGLNVWSLWLMRRLKGMESIVSDMLFCWLTLWASLQTLGVSCALIAYQDEPDVQAQILLISDYLQFGWALTALLLAFKDIYTYTRPGRKHLS